MARTLTSACTRAFAGPTAPLEMLDALAPGSRAALRWLARESSAVAARAVDRAEDAMRLAILGVDLQRLLGRGDRVGRPVLPHVEVGELGDDRRGRRIERHRALVGRHRAVSVVVFLETMGQQELLVRLRRPDRPWRAGGAWRPVGSVARRPPLRHRRGARRHHERNEQLHGQIVPQNCGVCHIFHRMAVEPGTARNSRLSELSHARHARQERHRAQVRHVQTCVSHQGRHPGDAHRGSHGRGVTEFQDLEDSQDLQDSGPCGMSRKS